VLSVSVLRSQNGVSSDGHFCECINLDKIKNAHF
jgi:hypothetical protein